MTSVSDILESSVLDAATKSATARGLRVVVKTSVTPRVVVYDTRDTSPSILSRLGVKYQTTIEDAAGNVVTSYGDADVQTNIVQAVIFWGAAALTGFAVVAMLARAIR